jgi:hypothetical protein
MRAPARPLTRCAALGSLALLASCGADERGLSFQLGTSTGSSTTGGAAGRGNAGTGSKGGATSSAPNENAGENAGGADGGAGADHGGAPGTSGTGSSDSGTGNGGTDMGGTTTGGTGTGGTGTSGGGGTLGGNAGSSGGPLTEAGAAGAPFAGPCGDLNRNLVDDCEETLVKNSRFETAALDWEPEGALQQAWVATNAKPGAASGSLSLRNTTFMAGSPVTAAMGSRQCLVAWGGDTYELAAQVFIKPGQGSGAAAIDLVFYGNDGCAGTVLGGKTAASVELVDAWRTARGQVQLPAGTRSVGVRLTVGKPLAQASFEALFDDVLVTKK